jgi:hypothetical protein
MRVARFENLRWLILGATVALTVSCGSAPGSRADGHPQAARAVPTAGPQDQVAVTRFIEDLRSENGDFQPAADWTAGRLILAVPDPTSEPWPGMEGHIVGGLEIVVLRATVSTRDYEHAISAVGRATFADRDRVESFGYPTDGSHVIVRVRGLLAMDPARRAALIANLERVADVPVQLVRAPHMVLLPAITKS